MSKQVEMTCNTSALLFLFVNNFSYENALEKYAQINRGNRWNSDEPTEQNNGLFVQIHKIMLTSTMEFKLKQFERVLTITNERTKYFNEIWIALFLNAYIDFKLKLKAHPSILAKLFAESDIKTALPVGTNVINGPICFSYLRDNNSHLPQYIA